jgi:hypothetical protein
MVTSETVQIVQQSNGSVSPLVFGHDGEWWDSGMLVALIAAGFVALAVAFLTYCSITAHKREAAAASEALERYKSNNEGNVARAKEAGIAAGKAASDAQAVAATAQADTAKAQAEAAKANERAALLEREALELSLQLERTRATFAGRDLSEEQVEKLKIGLAGHHYNILLCFGADPEARMYALHWEAALTKAGQSVVLPLAPCGGMTYGGVRTDTALLYIRGRDARTITDEPLWKAVESMGFLMGFSSQPLVAGDDSDATIELPSWAPPTMYQLQMAAKPTK